VYNVPDLRDDIHFTPGLLADIYLGKITRWNDPRIMKWNRGLALPDAAIVVVHRADGSGTTNAWSMFLARNSAEWKMNVGSGLQLAWPTGIGVDGNGGVAKTVHATKYSIGYVEEVYALQGQLSSGAVQNRAGEFVWADLESLGLAANSILSGSGANVGALDPSEKRAYPIATLTWILVPRQVDDAGRKSALEEMLRWALTSGQKACSALGYVPLPKDLAQKELQKLEQWR
jgi:phosphate transport system substrate-binding protein